jgi:CRISPR-associated protein Cas1
MEPYRPFADELVLEIISNGDDIRELNTNIKKKLFEIACRDVIIENQRSPLMIALQQTSSSLAKCYYGELRKIIYPEMQT